MGIISVCLQGDLKWVNTILQTTNHQRVEFILLSMIIQMKT